MGSYAHGAYKYTCHIHANHEQPIHQHAEFWCGSVLDDILMYSHTVK